MQHYSDPKRASDPHALPDIEVFYLDGTDGAAGADGADGLRDDDGEPLPAGHYWWPCFPGCLPDGDPIGPFASQAAACEDACAAYGDDDDERGD